MTHVLEPNRFVRSEDEPGALQPKTVERLFLLGLAVITIAWFSLLSWCVYKIAVLALF